MEMSALDIALWDCYGRTKQKPLWQIWKGKDEPLPIYGSGCYRGLGHDGMIEKAQKYVSKGFKSIKMQVAHCFTNLEDVQIDETTASSCLRSLSNPKHGASRSWIFRQLIRACLDSFTDQL